MSSTVTVTTSISVGTNLQYQVVDPLDSYNPQVNTQKNLTFNSGSGVKKVNNAVSRLCVIPPSGADTFNFNTGAVTGSETATLTVPGSGAAFTTTGVNVLEIDMNPGGSQTITVTGGSSNGFFGPISGSGSMTINGSDSTGYGGHWRHDRSDSIGWTVSSSFANFVVKNNDGANASTFTLTVAGQ